MKICHTVILVTIALWNCQGATVTGDENNPSFDCLAAYSKAKGLNEPEFDGVKYDSSSEKCTKAIAMFSKKIRSDVIEKMSEITSDKEQSGCIVRKFSDDDTFVNNIIKGEALAAVDDKDKSEKLREIEKFAEEFITTAISKCLETHDK